MRQSTLSRCIRQLEESIGVTVFERSSGGVCTTTAGRNFLRTARSILEQMDALVTSARYDGRGEAGRLAVGFYTSLSAGNLRATLVDFRQRCPQVELRMVERSRMRLVTALRNGAIDVVIATDAGPLFESKALPLWSERIWLLCQRVINSLRRNRSTGRISGMRQFCSASMIRDENSKIS